MLSITEHSKYFIFLHYLSKCYFVIKYDTQKKYTTKRSIIITPVERGREGGKESLASSAMHVGKLENAFPIRFCFSEALFFRELFTEKNEERNLLFVNNMRLSSFCSYSRISIVVIFLCSRKIMEMEISEMKMEKLERKP